MSTNPQMAGSQNEGSGWSYGISLFAGIMMSTVSAFGILQGLSAVLKDDVYVKGIDYVYKINLTGWGWIHLILGVIGLCVGIGIVMGQQWSRVAGMGLAMLQALAQFAFLPYYPLWALTVIALDIVVIWALSQEWSRAA